MSIKEIINQEKENTEKIIFLYKNGNFYNAYNLSAFSFYKLIMPHYTLKKKYVKYIKSDILKIGGPCDKILEKLSQEQQNKKLYISISDDKNIIKIYLNINDIDFDMIKEQYLELMNSPAYNDNEIEKTQIQTNTTATNNDDIINEIKNFNITSSTIQEIVDFIFKLKNMIH